MDRWRRKKQQTGACLKPRRRLRKLSSLTGAMFLRVVLRRIPHHLYRNTLLRLHFHRTAQFLQDWMSMVLQLYQPLEWT